MIPDRALLLGAALCLAACGSEPQAPPSTLSPTPLYQPAGNLPLFEHHNGRGGELYMPELFGPGAALLDFDGDGDLDVYLLQGQRLGPGVAPDPALGDRLWRNDLVPGGELRFTDVTAQANLVALGYGMGVAVGDFDNDGRPDLYVTNFGPDQLWRNRGDGTFEDVTAASGFIGDRWSVAALFFDYDDDGWLDLYVGHYLNFSWATHRRCRSELGFDDYCSPQAFAPEADQLWRNRADGTFEDVTIRVGLTTPGAGLGAAAADFDGDGKVDLFVANDQMANFLWLNEGGTFRDDAGAAGCALNAQGQAEASMGVAVGDPDHDGDPDLYLTHLSRETDTLYFNLGGGLFEDRTAQTVLAGASRPWSGFGVVWTDADNDGLLDLLIARGEVFAIPDQVLAGDPFPYHQPDQFFRQTGHLTFETVTVPGLEAPAASRAVVAGDLDNDGDEDLLITRNGAAPLLLINRTGQDAAWIGIDLVDAHGHRAIGARLEVRRRGRPPIWRMVTAGGSYAASGDPRITVGLGSYEGAVEVRVHGPWGVATWDDLPTGRYHRLAISDGLDAEEK